MAQRGRPPTSCAGSMTSAAGSRVDRLAGVGVVCHLVRPTPEECVQVVRTAEEAGADWCTLPDVIGWTDVWMALAAASKATPRILVGPGVTNPFTRHPLVTLSALATLDRVSGGRAILGIGAGGTELTTAAGIDRSDAPGRVRALVALVREAAAGTAPVPMAFPVPDAPVVGGARGQRMLEAVADCCDLALLWGLTHDDLAEAARLVSSRGTAIAWAPLRSADTPWLTMALVYGLLNSPVRTRRRLGVDQDLEARLRRTVTEGGVEAAAALVPPAALPEFTVGDDPEEAAAVARRLGAVSIVVQAFDPAVLPDRVSWAGRVLGLTRVPVPTRASP
jgi:5,10-methylenetetrahydromethanopterin reductase